MRIVVHDEASGRWVADVTEAVRILWDVAVSVDGVASGFYDAEEAAHLEKLRMAAGFLTEAEWNKRRVSAQRRRLKTWPRPSGGEYK